MDQFDVVFRDGSLTVRRGDVAWSSKDGRFIAARVGILERFRAKTNTASRRDAYAVIDTVSGTSYQPWHVKREAIADAKKLAREVTR